MVVLIVPQSPNTGFSDQVKENSCIRQESHNNLLRIGKIKKFDYLLPMLLNKFQSIKELPSQAEGHEKDGIELRKVIRRTEETCTERVLQPRK